MVIGQETGRRAVAGEGNLVGVRVATLRLRPDGGDDLQPGLRDLPFF